MLPTKIVIIGAGSAIFGLNTVSALLASPRLKGSALALVDCNPATLDLMARLAGRLNREWDAETAITTHAHVRDALGDAAFVVSAIEAPPREELWRRDWEIPLRHGLRLPYAENGSPGGLAHALRNIGPVLEIAHAMEQACPDAWFLNFSNPMMRICDAIARYTKIRVVGLCHQILAGYGMVGYVLAEELGFQVPDGLISTHADPDLWPRLKKLTLQALERVEIQAAGLNHFTWMLDLRDKRTGQNLYPLFAERWAAFDPTFEPLTRRVYKDLGCFPIPGDEHLCEYLPWLSDPQTRPWETFDLSLYDWERMGRLRETGHQEIASMADGLEPIAPLRRLDSEGALEIIENIAGAGKHVHLAVNLPNRGYISNLPEGAIVEVPGLVSGAGVQGVGVGRLPEPIAELCRREITVVQLCVDAAVRGDRQLALQSLLLSPGVSDLDTARRILDDYLQAYRETLPQFWG